ncbi:MAG TPA: cyanophycin synthetase, partial [Candidatus Saccharimonadales bacterium]
PYGEAPGAIVAGSHVTIDGIPIIRINELKLPGKHNWQNICAAVTAVWQISKEPEIIGSVLREFTSLPFRIEQIRSLNGTTYYDDSFASNPAATIAAIEAVAGSKILILGGKDRGLDLSDLIEALDKNSDDIRKVFLIGQAADRLADELKSSKFTNFEVFKSLTMLDIVRAASEMSQDGDSVILSPGFPSFDMFKNFEDRGLQFNEAVNSL